MTTTKPPRPARKLDMRPFYTRRIFELLAEHNQMTRGQISDALGVNKGTLIVYLRQMREDGIVRRNGYRDGAPLWELGEETVAPKKLGKRVEELHQRQASVPARQVGMWRDSLVAALFGPGQGAAVEGVA